MVTQTPSSVTDAVHEMKNFTRLMGKDIWGIIGRYPLAVQTTHLALAALPTTQVSVERLFCNMKFLLTYVRSRMKEDTEEAMLLIPEMQLFPLSSLPAPNCTTGLQKNTGN